jgi:hypothetical protein
MATTRYASKKSFVYRPPDSLNESRLAALLFFGE